MFVVISVGLSLLVLAALFYFSRKRQTALSHRFETLVLLRELLLLSRKHRAATHYALAHKLSSDSIRKVNEIYDNILEVSELLQSHVSFDSRPMYRIYHLKLIAMHSDWQNRTLVRNQSIHGKTIRHSMFLMDEVMIIWLIQSEREDMSREYHMNWQQILDCMEILTKLRMCIPDMEKPDEYLRFKFYASQTHRKLNQLSMICPISSGSPVCTRAMHALTEIASSSEATQPADSMYELTSDISSVVSQVYDQVLSDITRSLYQPLPDINEKVINTRLSVHHYM
ncbi:MULTISPECIES: hypothetical protein [Vibrio]|jgi:hypothetical protein|uniref:Uncharacterized protein n=1 Tax=Vibrio kanaloae TaxID=170673 RepID=A0ABV4LH98_9VIBR|nr:hypothetical protein [Vibrio kanaloae]KAB0466058.1 hypothetical protein F7Q89_04795 [Vibrio kanaloae]NOI98225.1 hypothetical protein [Vibrio kanaloae]OEF12873.1 hypothetical protein A132_18495 [Vibrio kanaloae 5S-149]QPK06677.1 hypothetical protein BTD91_16115 [Vibrio kanaloae]TKE91691.1 hypothetical protein FCV44_19095 [Vibrio kanaloae]